MNTYQTDFLNVALETKTLQFGSFTLKSKRQSPYFFNLGYINTGKALSSLANSYAQTIIKSGIKFDVLFGPAYKGIPLAAITVAKLAELDPENYGELGYAFNRKEKKDHGEGGSMVGSLLEGKRVLIIDDVITAGTAIKEAVEMILAEKGELVGCIIALDRQETIVNTNISATAGVSAEFNIPVISIVTLSDIITHLNDKVSKDQIDAMNEYRAQYSPKSNA